MEPGWQMFTNIQNNPPSCYVRLWSDLRQFSVHSLVTRPWGQSENIQYIPNFFVIRTGSDLKYCSLKKKCPLYSLFWIQQNFIRIGADKVHVWQHHQVSWYQNPIRTKTDSVHLLVSRPWGLSRNNHLHTPTSLISEFDQNRDSLFLRPSTVRDTGCQQPWPSPHTHTHTCVTTEWSDIFNTTDRNIN